MAEPLVVYAGTLGHINGVEYAVALAAEFKNRGSDVHMLVVGDGVEYEKVRDKAIRLGVWNDGFTLMPPVRPSSM